MSSFLFREFEGNKHAPKNYYSYKLFLDWNVMFEAPIKSEKGRKIRGTKNDQMEGVDEGGPTSQFISEFCKQLGELYVMLPVDTDILCKESLIDVLRDELPLKDFLLPNRGYKVKYNGRIATIKKYYSQDDTNKQGQKKRLNTADLSFDDTDDNVDDVPEVKRSDFEVTEIAIALFDQQTSGFVPLRDETFQNEYDRARPYSPKTEPQKLAEQARIYYRAVGRFLLHVMADGRNPIPSTTMPEIFRNVLLRKCMPGTKRYPNALVMTHLAQLDVDNFKDEENISKYFGNDFELYDIERKGQISKENFISDFVPGYVIESRRENLDALREGLTLDGSFKIDDFLCCQPLEAINQQFFSAPRLDLDDVTDILHPMYENQIPDEIERENHTLFLKTTLPQALDSINRRKPTFLVDFVFFVTGSRCIPYMKGIPDFHLKIVFERYIVHESLPSCHTCENLMHIPWNVYDNDVEVFMEKLEIAVKDALVAGFNMA